MPGSFSSARVHDDRPARRCCRHHPNCLSAPPSVAYEPAALFIIPIMAFGKVLLAICANPSSRDQSRVTRGDVQKPEVNASAPERRRGAAVEESPAEFAPNALRSARKPPARSGLATDRMWLKSVSPSRTSRSALKEPEASGMRADARGRQASLAGSSGRPRSIMRTAQGLLLRFGVAAAFSHVGSRSVA